MENNLLKLLVLLSLFCQPLSQTAAQFINFTVPDGGAVTLNSPGADSTLLAGYAKLQHTGSGRPSDGFAVLTLAAGNLLLSEMLVPAVDLQSEGRFFVETEVSARTAISLVNPNNTTATVEYYFSDASQSQISSGQIEIAPIQQFSGFLNEAPFNNPVNDGTLTFSSSVPIAAGAIRLFENSANEPLISSIPIAPVSQADSNIVFLPFHLAGEGIDGNVSDSTVILINTTSETQTGRLRFTSITGQAADLFTYSISPNGAWSSKEVEPPQESELPDGFLDGLFQASVQVIPDQGSMSPKAYTLITDSFDPPVGSARITSAVNVPQITPGTAFRYFIEGDDTNDSSDTLNAFYVHDVSGTTNSLLLELTGIDGLLIDSNTVPLPADTGVLFTPTDHLTITGSSFAGGILRISSTGNIVTAGLRSRVSGDENAPPKLMRIPLSDESTSPGVAPVYFPLIADSAGWRTEFFVVSGQSGATGAGTIITYSPNGSTFDFNVVERAVPDIAAELLAGEFLVLSADGVSNVVATMSFDGLGAGLIVNGVSYSEEETYNLDSVAIEYNVKQNYRAELVLEPGPEQQTFAGIVSPDSTSFMLASSDNEPSLMVAQKISSGLSNSILNGDFYASAGSSESDTHLSFHFDGAGNGGFEALHDLQEGDTAADVTIPLTYIVSSSGLLNVTVDENGELQEFQGIVAADGSAFNIASITGSANLIISGQKLSSGKTNADLNGRYVAGALIVDSTVLFAIDLDGMGGGSLITEDSDGNITSTLYELDYSVESDGQTMITIGAGTPEETTLLGVLAADNSHLTLVASSGSAPILINTIKAP